MGTSQDGTPPGPAPAGPLTGDGPDGGTRLVTAAGYVLLFVLGVLEGGIGSFQYSRPPAPAIAIVLAVVVFATCAGSGWGVGTVAAALLPAVGWILAAFVLASARANGSVVITATAAGEWYLYGGALACVFAVVGTAFSRFLRPRGPAGGQDRRSWPAPPAAG